MGNSNSVTSPSSSSSSSSSAYTLTAEDEARLFESEKACIAVNVAEVVHLADEERSLRMADGPPAPALFSDARESLLSELRRSVAAARADALADAELARRVAKVAYDKTIDELVRFQNSRAVDLAAELELSSRASRWFVPLPADVVDSKLAVCGEIAQNFSSALVTSLAEEERARRVESDLRHGVHEELARHHARSGAAVSLALEQLRRKSEPLILRDRSLQDAMADVMTSVVRGHSLKTAKADADAERTRRIAEEAKLDAQEELVRRVAIKTAMLEEELEMSARCSRWFQDFPEDAAAAKALVQEDVVRCFNSWAAARVAREEQQRRVAVENQRAIKETIERLGSARAAVAAEEEERKDRLESPRLPADGIAELLSELHTSIVRAVSTRDAAAAADVEGQTRAAAHFKLQFLADIERLGNRRAAAAAADQERASRLAQPASIKDKAVDDAMTACLAALVRLHAVKAATDDMDAEKQRRVVTDNSRYVFAELVRTVNQRKAIKEMEKELGRRIAGLGGRKSDEVKDMLASIQQEVVRSCAQRFAVVAMEEERATRIAAHNMKGVQEEAVRRVNAANADLAMNLELSSKCAAWFKTRNESDMAAKNDVQADLVRAVAKKEAVTGAEMERTRRVVDNARADVFCELDRLFARRSAIEKMTEEQKRRVQEPYVVDRKLDALLSDAQTKLVSKVATKKVKAAAERERTERVALDLKLDAQEEAARIARKKISSLKAVQGQIERIGLFGDRTRDAELKKAHDFIIQLISG